jgi:acetylornithine deacetylase
MNNLEKIKSEAIQLLHELIALPSFSKEESETAHLIEKCLHKKGVEVTRAGNNVLATSKYFTKDKPTFLLNSHHDTVKPNTLYTRDPFKPAIENGKLFGLGSNDAGGSLVSLLTTFLYFYNQPNLNYNLVFAATAEEEISGSGGIELALHYLPTIDCAIVGEPTQMQMAVAERGLMVLDATAHGIAGHAARNEGENAIYKAMADIDWFNHYQFEKTSELLSAVKMSVTCIETANKAHNIVPGECKYVVDVRVNEMYTLEEVLETIREHVQSDIKPRSMRIRSSSISLDHPLVQAGMKLARHYYGSPTTSDKALMPFPALKMGPGDSARSHTADEFIFVDEINEGIEIYVQLLNEFLL